MADIMHEVSDDEEAVHGTDEVNATVSKTRTAVWKFFEKNADRSVRCTICNAKLQYHGGTTST